VVAWQAILERERKTSKVLNIRNRKFELVAESHGLDELRDQLGSLDASLFEKNPVLVLLNSPSKFEIYSSGKNFDGEHFGYGRNIMQKVLLSIRKSEDGISRKELIDEFSDLNSSTVNQSVSRLNTYEHIAGRMIAGVMKYVITEEGIDGLKRDGL